MNSEIKSIIQDAVNHFSPTPINIYRVASYSNDLYMDRSGVSYEEPIEVYAVYWHFKDDDSVVKEGRESMDYVDITIPVKSIEDQGFLISDIELDDFIEIEGRTFGIIDIRPTGRAYGSHTSLFIRALENKELLRFL